MLSLLPKKAQWAVFSVAVFFTLTVALGLVSLIWS